jgi:hypothetical protein
MDAWSCHCCDEGIVSLILVPDKAAAVVATAAEPTAIVAVMQESAAVVLVMKQSAAVVVVTEESGAMVAVTEESGAVEAMATEAYVVVALSPKNCIYNLHHQTQCRACDIGCNSQHFPKFIITLLSRVLQLASIMVIFYIIKNLSMSHRSWNTQHRRENPTLFALFKIINEVAVFIIFCSSYECTTCDAHRH